MSETVPFGLFLRTLCSVLGASLLTVSNTLSIKSTADDMITYTGKVTDTAAADENYRVLLKVVTDTGNVCSCFHSVGKSYSGNLTKSRVRLLGAGCGNLCAYASLLGRRLIGCLVVKCIKAFLKHGCFRLIHLIRTTLSYKLVKGWHFSPPSLEI